MFFFFVGTALFIILLLHYRIKQRKKEELQHLEELLQNIDFFQTENQTILERSQYLLSLHDKISLSYDWPIKRIFVVELLLAVLPLLVSHLL